MKAKKIFTNFRIILLILILALALIAINPKFSQDGVAIRQITKDSSAALGGLQNPLPTTPPTGRERIISINNIPINDEKSYYEMVNSFPPNRSLTITTNKNTYRLTTIPNMKIEYVNETITNTTVNITTNKTQTVTSTVLVEHKKILNGTQDLGITVYKAPINNLRLGLDLSGGTRVILKPKEKVNSEDLNLVMDNIKQRLNVYGLSDIVVKSSKDLAGDDYVIVEIAGANKNEVENLLSQQGKFEAKIGQDSIFKGGKDITYVCRSAECSGIDRNYGCGQATTGYACRFSFQISLSPEAAKRQADSTQKLSIKVDQGGNYLEKPLDLYLDNEKVDTLQISSDLKGRVATDIVISGSGSGATQQEAAQDTINNMKRLQTVLITGSMPVQLEIIKSDGISPMLGSSFISNAILIGLLSILAVTVVLIVRYRKPIIAIPIVVTMMSEVFIILGFAAWVGWNLDLASIAAIIIAIGSGVDDQIIIIDETIHSGKRNIGRSWKERISQAFFIIFASYFTLVAAMIPLWFAGAGLLRGFAITTIVGVTAGVLITRPAFAVITEILLKKEDDDEK